MCKYWFRHLAGQFLSMSALVDWLLSFLHIKYVLKSIVPNAQKLVAAGEQAQGLCILSDQYWSTMRYWYQLNSKHSFAINSECLRLSGSSCHSARAPQWPFYNIWTKFYISSLLNTTNSYTTANNNSIFHCGGKRCRHYWLNSKWQVSVWEFCKNQCCFC